MPLSQSARTPRREDDYRSRPSQARARAWFNLYSLVRHTGMFLQPKAQEARVFDSARKWEWGSLRPQERMEGTSIVTNLVAKSTHSSEPERISQPISPPQT